ncbi:MAG: ABC transporter ATP-binding protein [Elusimicrobiales bacterium]
MSFLPQKKELYISLLSYLKEHKKRLFFALLTMVILSIIRATIVYLVGPFIQSVFIERNEHTFKVILIVLPFLFVVRMLAEYANNYTMNYIGQRVIQRIRESLFLKICNLPLEFYWRNRSGDILSRVMNDLGNIQGAVQFIPLYGVRDVGTVIFVTIALFYINFKLAVFSFIFIPSSLYFLRYFGKKMKRYSKQSQEVIGHISHNFQETLGAIPVIKAYNYEDEVSKKFINVNNEYFAKIMGYLRATSISGPVMELIGSFVIYILMIIGYYMIKNGSMKPADFFSFTAAFITAYTPFKNISNMNSKLQIGLASWERIYSILNEKPVIEVKRNAIVLKDIKGKIEFEDVYYRYPTSKDWVLKGISFVVEPNEVVAFVGRSGSGKSTIIQLILRFFDPQKGVIKIDGYDIRDVEIKSLRNFISVVSQDTMVFNDTIRNNILVGNTRASESEIRTAAEISDSISFIEAMPFGFETIVGERGVKISGGQRQRLAIARAVVRKPRIMLLDEATSNLDSKTELYVQRAIENSLKGKTVIITAHRLSTIVNAARIFVLKNGVIVESGTHRQLIEKSGEYYQLYKKQNI